MRFLFVSVIILILSLLLATRSNADDFHVIDLQELSIDYKNYAMLNDHARDLLIYPESPKESLNLGLKTNLLIVGYWDSTVESLTTGSQYRAVGLETRLGIRLTDNLLVGYYHHSQHVLDREEFTIPKFSSEDAVEVRLILFRASGSRQSIF